MLRFINPNAFMDLLLIKFMWLLKDKSVENIKFKSFKVEQHYI